MTWTTQQRCNIGQLAAITRGEGSLVVLIHGVGLRAEAWAGQITELAKNHRIVAVDMPGHGESAALDGAPTLAEFTNAIATVLDTRATVIGHSFGAMIALDLARVYPERVTAVGALNAIYRRDHDAKAAVAARAGQLNGLTMADPSTTLDRWFGDTHSPEHDACRGWLCATDPAGYRDAYRVFAHEDGPSDETLRSLHCPALFITGAEEPNSTPQMSSKMAAMTPKGRAEVIADAAHMLPMTHSKQANAFLTDFIQTQRI